MLYYSLKCYPQLSEACLHCFLLAWSLRSERKFNCTFLLLCFFSQVVLFLSFVTQISLRSWEPGKVIVQQWLDLCTAEKFQNISDVPDTAQRVSSPKLGLKPHVFHFSADTGSLLTFSADAISSCSSCWLAGLASRTLSLPQETLHKGNTSTAFCHPRAPAKQALHRAKSSVDTILSLEYIQRWNSP